MIYAFIVILVLSVVRDELRLRAFASEREALMERFAAEREALLNQGLLARERLEERYLDAEREWHAQRSELLSRIQTPELAVQRITTETEPEFETEEAEEFARLAAQMAPE